MEGNQLEKLKEIYRIYIRQVEDLQENASPTDGIFGLSSSVKKDRCHDEFAQAVKALCEESAEAGPSSEEAKGLLDEMLDQSVSTDNNVTLYMMLAVHQFGTVLVPCLTKEDAGEIAVRYQDAYSPDKRLPSQDMLLDALLKKAEMAKRKKGGLLGRLFRK